MYYDKVGCCEERDIYVERERERERERDVDTESRIDEYIYIQCLKKKIKGCCL